MAVNTNTLEQQLHAMLDSLELSDLTKQCLFERMAHAAYTTALDDSHKDFVITDTDNGLSVFTADNCAESCMNRI